MVIREGTKRRPVLLLLQCLTEGVLMMGAIYIYIPNVYIHKEKKPFHTHLFYDKKPNENRAILENQTYFLLYAIVFIPSSRSPNPLRRHHAPGSAHCVPF